MSQLLEVNDKPAVKILAKQLKEGTKAILFDCEGDKHWFPKSCIKVLSKESILVQKWLYDQTFKERVK